MLQFSEKKARIIAWAVFIAACLLVVAFVWWMFMDGLDVAKGRFMNFGTSLRVFLVGAWTLVADALTNVLDTCFGGFTGTDFKAINAGHWVMLGLLGLGVIFAVFWMMFFRD